MSFDWSQYLNLAYQLFGRRRRPPNREAKLRAAISRAYYAAFILVRNYLLDVAGHLIPPDANPHHYVQLQFRLSNDVERQQIANKLYELRRYRNQADYDNQISGSLKDKASRALILADQIIAGLNRI